MRTTKEELAWLRCLADEAWEGRAQETLRRAIDDAADAADAQAALSTIAIAAGLGADATAEEVAARVGEMRGALIELANNHGMDLAALRLGRGLAEEPGRG